MKVILMQHTVNCLVIGFLVAFSTIPRSFGALSIGFCRILLSTFLSSLALSILLLGFLGSLFMDPVNLNLLTIYCTVNVFY